MPELTHPPTTDCCIHRRLRRCEGSPVFASAKYQLPGRPARHVDESPSGIIGPRSRQGLQCRGPQNFCLAWCHLRLAGVPIIMMIPPSCAQVPPHSVAGATLRACYSPTAVKRADRRLQRLQSAIATDITTDSREQPQVVC